MGKKKAAPAGTDAGDEGPKEPVYLPDGVDCLAGEGKVRIYKFVNGEYELCATRERDVVAGDIESMAREFGGGKFRLETLDPEGNYEHRYTIKFSIFAFPQPSSSAEKAPSGGTDLTALMTAASEERRASAAAIEKANDRVMGMFTEMNKTFLAAMTAQQNKPQPDALSNVERMVQMVSTMLAPLMGDRKGGPDFDTIWSMIERGMEMGRKSEGGGGSFMDNLKDIMPMVKEVLATRTVAPSPLRQVVQVPESNPPSASALQQIPRDTAAPSQAAPGAVSGNGIDPKVAAVKSSPFYPLYVPKLLDAMRHHSDIGETADAVIDACPPRYLDSFVKEVDGHNITDILAVYEPEVREHDEWIKSLWREILDAVTGPEAPVPDEKPEPEPAPEPEAVVATGGRPAESAE